MLAGRLDAAHSRHGVSGVADWAERHRPGVALSETRDEIDAGKLRLMYN